MSKLEMPEGTRLVHAFVNSLDLRAFKRHGEVHQNIDELASPERLTAWLRERELIDPEERASQAELRKALRLRDHLRAAVGEPGRVDIALGPLDWPMRVTVEAGRPPSLTAAGLGVQGALGRIVLAAVEAVSDDTWRRLKCCAADDCRWIFFDRTKPGRGRWCEPELCGNRMKTRAYRERRRQNAPSDDDHASTPG